MRLWQFRGRTLEDHGFGLQERQQALGAALAADAGLLEAAKGDPEVGSKGVVAHRSRPKPSRDVNRTLQVVGEHRRIESVDRVVREFHGMVLVVRRYDGEDRTEDLFLSDS